MKTRTAILLAMLVAGGGMMLTGCQKATENSEYTVRYIVDAPDGAALRISFADDLLTFREVLETVSGAGGHYEYTVGPVYPGFDARLNVSYVTRDAMPEPTVAIAVSRDGGDYSIVSRNEGYEAGYVIPLEK